jgi:hypothetical protein
MANIKISELNPLLTVQDADVIPIVDNAITKKVTAEILRGYTQGNSVLLTGAQTIAGIKTFTSQLASSVATGTAPFSVASTTKVTNLNADLLDGLSSADFQATLSGTGIVKSTAGTISYLTDNSTNWNTAFNDKINSAAVTGSGTNTLTLTQQDAGTITATWVNGTLIREIRNNTGATLTKGTIVYISGATGNKPTVSKAIATGDSTSAQTFGFVQENIANNANGYVVVIGDLTGVDTSAFTEGDQLYLSSTTAGAFTSTKQYAPNHLVYVGIVTRSHPTLGQIEVNIQNGYEMDELHNVAAQSPSNGDILQYVTSTGLWTKIAGSTTNISEGTNLYFTDARARAAISLTTTGTSGAATYTSGVLNIPQYQAVLTNPITGTGTTNYLPKFTGASALGNSILQEGTVAIGLGVTPSAWVGTSRALQIGTRAALWDSGGATLLGYNVFNDGVNKYLVTGSSMRYFMSDGGHTWNIAPSGTAGGAITFTTAMTLDTNGQLSTFADAIINGVKVGRGAGNIATNTAVGFESLSANTSGSLNSAFGYRSLKANTTGANNTCIGHFSAGSNTTGGNNTAVGVNTFFFLSTGSSNTAIGISALQSISTQNNNTAVGQSALQNNTASNNTAVGFEAALTNTSATGITAIGYQSLRLSTGANNTALGGTALTANTTGTSNTAIGFQSLLSNTTGIENTAIGLNSLVFNVSGSYNTAIGRGSLQANTIGNNNTAVGFTALVSNTAGNNTAVGFEAANANTSGIVTAIGYRALKANTTGFANTAIGSSTLVLNTTGNGNTAIGVDSLGSQTTANSNTAIGTGTQSGNFDASVIIGREATATAANQFVVGSVTYPAGAVATEVLVSDRSWAVRINGTAYKILLKA